MRMLTVAVCIVAVFAVAQADSLNVRKIGGLDIPGWAHGVCLSGNYAYIGDGTSGLRVIDVSNPSNPVEAGHWLSPDYARGVDVSGDHVFVACGYADLRIINVSNPSAPVEVGACDLPGYAWDVALMGDHAFIACEAAGLYVVDISDPTAPTITGNCDTPGSAKNVAVAGSHAYIADLSGGLRIINAANRQSPVEVAHHTMPELSYGVTYADSHVYMGNLSMLRIINVSNPASPYEVGSLARAGASEGLAVSGRLVFLAQSSAGMRVVDVADRAAPAEIGFYYQQSPLDLVVSGRYVYCADVYGLRIYEYYGPGVIVEGHQPDASLRVPAATLVCRVLRLPASLGTHRSSLITADGRKVMELVPGDNDVSRLAPGVCFVVTHEQVQRVIIAH